MSLPKILKKISEGGYITESSISKLMKPDVKYLVSINALQKKVMKRGTKYSMGNQEIFDSEISSRYPNGLDSAIHFGKDASRFSGVKSFKNAKISRKKYATVQVFINTPSEVIIGGTPAPRGIEQFALSVLVDSLPLWEVNGRIVLVENQEPFLRSPSLFYEASAIICYNGRVDDKLSKWLVNSDMNVIICPDYDPVGLDEYCKLKSKLGDRLEIFLPESISKDFKFSTPEILELEQNRKVLQRLANSESLDSPAREILSLIQEWNAGLMQEIYFPD